MNQYNNSFKNSIRKWKSDIEYLSNHEVHVGVGKLILSNEIIDITDPQF